MNFLLCSSLSSYRQCLDYFYAVVFISILGVSLVAIKKAECRKIDAFELWCWRRLLRVPWTARRTNQSILKEISPGCSLEGLMLKLKRQYFGHLMRRVDSLEKTLMLGGIEGRRRGNGRGWDGWMASPTQRTWVWVDSRSFWWTGKPGMLRFMGSQSQTRLSNWTELNWIAWNQPGWKYFYHRNVQMLQIRTFFPYRATC